MSVIMPNTACICQCETAVGSQLTIAGPSQLYCGFSFGLVHLAFLEKYQGLTAAYDPPVIEFILAGDGQLRKGNAWILLSPSQSIPELSSFVW